MRPTLSNGCGSALFLVLAANVISPVNAQAVAPQAAEGITGAGRNASAAANDAGDDIVVTARRREERLQEVPVAVTAFSGRKLQEANVTRIENLGNVAPSLQVTTTQGRANVPGFALRGQRQDAGFITNDASVGVYVAEAVQARVFGLAQSLFDLESVQVLRGPQGTLFGRNTTGGAILFQPAKPELGETGGHLTARYGNYDRFDVQGTLNVPIGEAVALRVGFNRTRRDGFVTNVSNGQDLNAEHTDSYRGILLIKPSEAFSNTTYVDYFKADAPGTAARLIAVNPAGSAQRLFNLSAVLARQSSTLGFYETEGNVLSRSAGSNFGITNVTTNELSDVLTIKNVLNYRKIKSTEDQDQDATDFAVLGTSDIQQVRQISEELQLQGKAFDDRLNYIVGGYYFREKGFRATLTTSLGALPSPRRGDAVNSSYSVFAQGDYKLVDSLTLTLGGRYTWDRRKLDQQLLSATTGACTFCASTSAKFSAPTYTATLSWQLDSDRLIYAATRRGYRSGGFNSSGNNAASILPFDPETVTDYEIGIKADWHLGGAFLRTNLAAYRAYYKDIQRSIILPINNVPITSIFNAASATIDGAEAEVEFRPIRWIQFSGSLAYTNPDYRKFQYPTTTGALVDQSGNRFAYIPKWTYRLAARVSRPIGSSGTSFVASTDFYHQSSIYFAEFNAPINHLPGWGLLSGRLELNNIGGSGIDAALWGRNLTDRKYYQSGGDVFSSTGIVYTQYGEPRTYGLEMTIRF